MKRILTIASAALFLWTFHQTGVPTAHAACGFSHSSNGATATTCGIDAQSSEYYDYSAGVDDATNGYTLTVPAGVTVTLNAGALGTPTRLYVGKLDTSQNGAVAISANYVQVTLGEKCYVLDSDGDLYSPTPTTCSTTGGAGYIRKNKLAGLTADCGDGNASAKPGQTTYSSSSFTNTATGLSYDWNCDGTQTQTYATATYACSGCTNGSGYGSSINTSNGFSGSVPACGAAGTYYTVTNGSCLDPAVGGCSGAYSTSSVTQTCL